MDTFDLYILEPWWQLYTAWKPEFEGNIRCYKDWKPRQGVVLYAFLLFVFIIFISILSIYISNSSQLLASIVLIFGIFTSGFSYTNYVTSARSFYFIGKHGSYRDYMIVVTCIPFIVWLNIYIPGFHHYLFESSGQSDISSNMFLSSSLKFELSTFLKSVSLSIISAHTSLDLGFFLGLHVLYFTRPGSLLSGSFALSSNTSGKTLLKNVGFLLKLFFILLNIHFHFLWCASRGELILGVLLWHIPWFAIACVALWMKKKWYLHLHHWFLGT
jgi:hypothetical protein